jgi:hypothetical protein
MTVKRADVTLCFCSDTTAQSDLPDSLVPGHLFKSRIYASTASARGGSTKKWLDG